MRSAVSATVAAGTALLVTAALLLLISPFVAAYSFQYDVTLDQNKGSSTLTNVLTLVQDVSEDVTLNATTGFTAERSKDLDRFTDLRNGSASLSYRLSNVIELSTNLSRQLELRERYGELISDKLQNTATGQIRCNPADWFSMMVSLGTHFEEYETVSADSLLTGDDSGGVTNISISVSHRLTDRLSTSLEFDENRTMGRQTDRNMDDISGRMSYDFPGLFEGGNILAQVGASRQQVVYHDSRYSNNLQRYYSSFTVTCPTIIPSLTLELSTDWSWEDKFWVSEDDNTGSGED